MLSSDLRMPTNTGKAWALALLVAALSMIVFWFASGMQRGSMDTPMVYGGDALQYGYIVQSFAQSGGLSNIHNAGAPFTTQNIDFPNGDLSNMAVAAVLFSGGYGLGFNLYLLFSVGLTAAAGFAIARRCRLSPGLAFIVGLAFALLPFHFQRMVHLFYGNYSTAVVALWLALRLASPLLEPSQSRNRRWLGVAAIALACIWCGTTGVYYAFFTCIVLAVAALVQSAQQASLRPAIRAGGLGAIIVLCVAVQLIPTQMFNRENGPNPSVAKRGLIESEIYSLRMAQMLLPVQQHRVPLLAKVRAKYDAESTPVNENGTATLGALASAGFVMGLLMLFMPSVRRHFHPSQQLCAVLLMALFLYATMGGLGSLFALFVSPQIRALNRISPYIALFSLIISGATLQLIWNHLREKYPRFGAASGIVAGVGLASLALFVIADQISPSYRQPRQERAGTATRYQYDRAFGQQLTAKLPAGAMVMQLPYMSYPESADEVLGSYTQFRNTLHAPGLHWSHGAMRARPEGNWLADVNALPPSAFVDAIQAVGFSALVLDQRALTPKMTEIQTLFAQRTHGEVLSDTDGSQVATISGVPVRATARAFIEGSGWSVLEQDEHHRWTWSSDRPTFALSPAPAGAASCEITLTLGTIRPMNVRISDGAGRTLSDVQLRPESLVNVQLDIPADTQKIVLQNDAPAVRAGEGDPRMLAIRWERTGEQLPLCRYRTASPK
ncbi:hypothetical protein ACPEH1_16260 [Stenotrophomonas sp. NPDC077421]|uniref:hypothetical protein n=1 Tax=unclassified Stenotrophomonas TaxID=196198 RepID=UPI0013102F7F|nr:hypothetical protein [Stenotrophomonas sp.]